MKKGSCLPNIFSQVIYSGGYSDGEPPLPIPNREAKPVIADGTARPGGRVGSRRAWKESSDERSSGDSFSCLQVCEEMPCRTFRFLRLEDVASVAPSIEVKILHLSTLYGHACFSLSCSWGRTMFECILVLSYFLAVSFSWVYPELRIYAQLAVPYFCFPVSFSTLLTDKCIRNCLYLN